MRTTAGKTKHARPPARPVQICIMKGENIKVVATKKASTLKQAMLEYYSDVLEAKGFTDPHVQGNSLTVSYRGLEDQTYFARDVPSLDTRTLREA